MISAKNPFLSLFTLRNICSEHVFLGILNTILFNFPSNPFHVELRIRSIQIVVITSCVVISNVAIKRVDCITLQKGFCITMRSFWLERYLALPIL